MILILLKKKAEFEESIIRDLHTLGVKEDRLSHRSDYFDYYIKQCDRIIKLGYAYADKTLRAYATTNPTNLEYAIFGTDQ